MGTLPSLSKGNVLQLTLRIIFIVRFWELLDPNYKESRRPCEQRAWRVDGDEVKTEEIKLAS